MNNFLQDSAGTAELVCDLPVVQQGLLRKQNNKETGERETGGRDKVGIVVGEKTFHYLVLCL